MRPQPLVFPSSSVSVVAEVVTVSVSPVPLFSMQLSEVGGTVSVSSFSSTWAMRNFICTINAQENKGGGTVFVIEFPLESDDGVEEAVLMDDEDN